jgi:hypothetical protein
MKRRCLLSLGLGLFCAAQGLFAMNNSDIVKMVGAKLDESTIIAAVKTAEPDEFDVSADGLIALKQSGVSDAIIQAILAHKQATAASVAVPAPVPRITFNDVPDAEVLPPEVMPVAGREYFVRHSFMFEEGERPTTNYWRGELVPINTRVVLVGMRGQKLTLRLVESGQTVVVVNVPKYSGRSPDQIARELLAESATAIEKYGEDMAAAIRAGTLRLGMTKTQVKLTRGYPPAHETPSLDGDQWKYWSNRFVVQTLVFENGVLTQGRGLN